MDEIYRHLRQTVDSFIEITDKQWREFLTITRVKVYNKGDIILRPGSEESLIAYINYGITRHYIIDHEAREKNTDFCLEGEFTGVINPFDKEDHNLYWLQALSRTEMIIIDSKGLENLIPKIPQIRELISKLTMKYYQVKCRRERELLFNNPKELYKLFLKNFPGLDQKIPQYHIASYLGLTRETLSRIRGNM